MEPTCPFSVRAFGKLEDLLDKAGEDRITVKVRLQSQPWHMYSGVIVRCILAASTLKGGKTAAKSVMAAVAAHREEFEFDRHCSGPNLDATPNDIIRRIERDSALVDLVALMGNYAATAAFGSICSLLSIRSSMRTRNYLCRPTQFRRTDNP